jgi:hypothetical protein
VAGLVTLTFLVAESIALMMAGIHPAMVWIAGFMTLRAHPFVRRAVDAGALTPSATSGLASPDPTDTRPMDPEASARLHAAIHPEPGTRAWVGRDLDERVGMKWAARSMIDTKQDWPALHDQLANAEAAIQTICQSARLAGLLTDSEVVALLGEEEAAARAVVSLLRGGATYAVVTRQPDGTMLRQAFGPSGEEPVPLTGRKTPPN